MNTKTSLLVILALISISALGGDWPYFRGPNSDGIHQAGKAPLTWSETKNIKWKISIPGRGHSSPVIKDGNIFLTTAIEENARKERYVSNMCFHADRITLLALCIDAASGKIKWQTELFKLEKPQPVHTLNSFSTPTPAVDDTHLFCDFGDYGTACVNTKDGKIVWSKKLPLDHEVGPGSSTILYRDLVILIRDGRDVRYITALNKKDGKEAWKTKRPPVTGENSVLHKSFSSPIIFESKGKPQLVAPCAQWIASYNPVTGKELWRLNHGKGFSLAAQPTEANGMVYYCNGFSGNQVIAVRHDGSGDVTKTHKVWDSKKFVPTISSPVISGNRIYWANGSGVLSCSNAENGEFIWKKTVGGKFYSALTISGNRIYAVNQTGRTTVFKTGDTFKKLAENNLTDAMIMATPAFTDNAIILRTDKHLYRIEE